MSNLLYSATQLRQIEQAYELKHGNFFLMKKAGLATADYIADKFPDCVQAGILILAGPGNNGGDGLVAASSLLQRGYRLLVVCCNRDGDDLPHYQGAAALAWQEWQMISASYPEHAQVLTLQQFMQLSQLAPPTYGLIVDALFGLGLQRALSGEIARLVEFCNQLRQQQALPILALDLPTGIHSDSGARLTADAVAICASHTLSFLADKPGLHTADALDYVGELTIADLDLQTADYPVAEYQLLNQHYPYVLPAKRLNNSHKGVFGDLYLLGGAVGMQGALLLAARAARMLGVGRLFLGFLEQAPAFDPIFPELMCRPAEQLDLHKATVVLGPGLGQSPAAQALCARVFSQAACVVVDADALNCLAHHPELQEIWRAHPGQTRLLTPHPLEAARLLAGTSQQVQAQRFVALRDLCERYQAQVILKGAGSLVAAPGSRCFINSSGNHLLAAGGTGDILSGLCGALALLGLPMLEAAKLACYLHGAAADKLAIQHPGWPAASSDEILRASREVYAELLMRNNSQINHQCSVISA